MSVDGKERSYLIHIPPNAPKPAPVVLVFHGGGGRPKAIERKTGFSSLADKNGFIAVYPAGEQRPDARGGTWNVGTGFTPSSADDVAFVKSILHELDGTMAIDHARVYAVGHSMGGVFAYRLACEMSDTFAAIAAVSATMVEPSCQPSGPVAILHIHGTDDERIPLNGGRGKLTAAKRTWPAPSRGIAAWSHFDGCADGQPPRSTEGAASCTNYARCRAAVQFCVIRGGPHAWPGAAASGNEEKPGDDVGAAFPASERIWAFFAAHPKQAR